MANASLPRTLKWSTHSSRLLALELTRPPSRFTARFPKNNCQSCAAKHTLPPAAVVHQSRHDSQSKDTKGGSPGSEFFGNMAPSGDGGRQIIYTGALNKWIAKAKLGAGVITTLPLAGVPFLLAHSVVPIEHVLPFLTASVTMPWLAIYTLSKNYVTTLYRYPPQRNPKSKLSTELLAFETRTLWNAPREHIVPLSSLRYNPSWVTRLWQTIPDASGRKKGFFLDPKVVKSDPFLGRLWETVRKQTPENMVSKSWFHKERDTTEQGSK